MDLDLTQISEQMKSQAAATLQELIGIYSEGGDPVTTGSAEHFPYGQGVQDSFAYMLSEAETLEVPAEDMKSLEPLLCDSRGRLEFEIARKLSRGPAGGSGLELRHLSGGITADRVPDKARAVLLYRDAAAAAKTKGRAKRAMGTSRSAVNAFVCSAPPRNSAAEVYEQIRTRLAQYREDTGYHLTAKRVGKSLEILAGGKTFHASDPEKGVNAVAVLLGFLDMLELENDDLHDFVRFYREYIAFDPYGEKLGISCGDEEAGTLTACNSIVSYDRRVIRIRMDVRYPRTVTEEEIYGKLTPLMDENGLGIVKLSRFGPLLPEEEEPEQTESGEPEASEEAGEPDETGNAVEPEEAEGGEQGECTPAAAAARKRFYQLIGLDKNEIVGE